MKTYSDTGSNTTIRERLGLRPIINVSGTMTTLGASIIVPEAISAMAEIASQWVEMDDLQRAASVITARLTGGEAGFITACCASGITMAIAGAMTGTNLLAIERLPDDTEGLKSEVVIQLGHIVNYGAPIDQSIRVAGAKVIPAGTVSVTQDYHVREAINERTAAALYVVAHHTVQYGMLSLEEFCEICHARGVPVIVDAASEYDLRSFLARGADIVVYSGHKFLSGPTSGIVTGRKDLVRAAYLQNRGVARAMKVGKESIAGTMAALEAWEKRDHAGIRRREEAALNLWKGALQAFRASPRTSFPTRPPIRSTGCRSSSRPKAASPPPASPRHWPPARRRSSCATTRSSAAISSSTRAICTPARPRSSPNACAPC